VPGPRGQPRRVPHRQPAQRRVVACRQRRDQLVIVHHHIYCAEGWSGSRQDSAESTETGTETGGLIRDDLAKTGIAALGHQFPGLRARVAAAACRDALGRQLKCRSPFLAAYVPIQAVCFAAAAGFSRIVRNSMGPLNQ